MRQEHDVQCRLQQGEPRILPQQTHPGELGHAAGAGNESRQHRRQARHGQHQQHKRRQDHCGPQRQGPGDDQGDDTGRRHQRPAQVVENLPQAHQRNRAVTRPITATHPAEEPRQQLPVTARPAMCTRGGHVIARRKFLDDLDVRNEAGSGIDALEQVVAQQHVVRHAAGEGGLEGVDVIDPLANVRTLAAQILIDVRHRRGVRIDAADAGQQALEHRASARHRQCGRHARLQDAVALDDASAVWVEAGLVDRVCHLAYEPTHRIAREPGIRVERDDVANPGRYGRAAPAGVDEAGVGGAAQQAVQLVKLAALPLPSHPLALRGIPVPSSMEQHKPVTAGQRAVARVQRVDAGDGRVEQRGVAGGVGRVGIGPIRQKREMDLAVEAGQMMHLEMSDVRRDGLARHEHRWHGDQRAQLRRNAVAKFQSRQAFSAEPSGDHAVHDRDGSVDRRDESDEDEHREQPGVGRDGGQGEQGQCQKTGAHERSPDKVAAHARRRTCPPKPGRDGRAIAKRFFKGPAAAGDQVVARVALPCCRSAARRSHRALRNVEFGMLAAACQALDRRPVAVAGRKVHARKFRAIAQCRIDQADFLQEVRPLDGGYRPHAGDHIADRDVRRALPVVLVANDLVGRGPVRREAPVEPGQRGCDLGILVAQPKQHLHGERGGNRLALPLLKNRVRQLAADVVDGQQPVGKRVGLLPGAAPTGDLLGRAAQVLDQDDPQRDGDRPQLADRQRLHALVRADESRQVVRDQAAVGVSDVCPCQTEHARVTCQRPVGELRQLSVVLGRQVVADLPYLRFDDVVVVYQPFGRRCDRPALGDCRRN